MSRQSLSAFAKASVPVVFSTDDTFGVGEGWGTPISPTYEPPIKFTGTLKQVTIEST